MRNEIILIGGNSFSGRVILPSLLEQYDQVHVVCRSECNFESDSRLHIHITDDLESDKIKDIVQQCNFGLYFASATTPAKSATSPVIELNENVSPLINFLNSLQLAKNFTLLYVSSGGTIYGNAISGPIVEDQPFSPRSYYAAGKIASESFVHAFSRQTSNNAIILRPSNFYGAGQPYVKNFGIIRTVFEHIKTGEPITIWGDGENYRDFLYIDDFVSACLHLLKHPPQERVQTFNVSSGESYSLNQICDLIDRITGKPLERVYKPIRQIDVKNIELDSNKLRNTGWAPEINIEHGLKLMWEWIKTQ